MDRNREARRTSMAASANGLSRRRHRSTSLRDSPEEDGPVELQEPARLRDRGVKKDRDRDRDRERDRERSSRSKRRRGDRLMHGSNREDGVDDSSEESVNDEEEDDDDEGGGGSVGGGAVRMLPPNPVATMSSSFSNHHHLHRKTYPPSSATKTCRPVQGWKPADEMIGFSVPRKARSASTKRSHECWNSGSGVGAEQIHRQASTSPVRQNLASTSAASPAPVSPSSSNASVRKKMKPNGPKLRPPKSSSKSSSNPEELEIEIAEVLYGLMTQSQGPSKKESSANDSAKFDSRELNKSSSDAKSRVSSPISNSNSTAPQSSALAQNSYSSATPLSAVAPKRKRPRQVSDNLGSYGIRNSPSSSITTAAVKVEMDQPPKTDISSPNFDKNPEIAGENGSAGQDFTVAQAVPLSAEAAPPAAESTRPETGSAFAESKPAMEESREGRDVGPAKEEVVTSPQKESPTARPEYDRDDATATKANAIISEIESHQREEKFQIDLMAPPPQLRSSPDRDGEINFVAVAERKPAVPDADAEMRPVTKDEEDEKALKSGREEVVIAESELKKSKATVDVAEPEKPVVSKERNIDLHLDLEKPEREIGSGNVSGYKLLPHVQKHHQQQPKAEPSHTEKTAQSSSLPLSVPVAPWPGGLPQLGYMAPLQGVVSMDGSPVPSTPVPPLFSQPRPKRCATHCYIARNIHILQQFMKMNPFWPAAAGSASLFGAKPCNLNVVPPAELQGNVAGRSINTGQDKGQGQGQSLAVFPGHPGKDKVPQASNIADAQRKQQILLQQALPPGASPGNILHGPAFIFPLNQQQAAVAAAASVRPASTKSPTTVGSIASTNASASASASANGSATAAPTVSFNYPNMPSSETQYLAILQNNAYPFPIPAVGAPPNYRGTHAQAMPYFSGSYFSSQMIHPLQLQQQQQPSTQPQQMQQQGHQNTSMSSGSSSSQKHLQNQQQRPQGSSTNGGNGSGNLHGFPAPKSRPSEASQQQPIQHFPMSHQSRQLETEVGGEDSPSTADSNRVSRATMSIYGQNFAVPIHHQNFALMTPPVLGGTSGGGGNQGDKKQQQQNQQQQNLKGRLESLTPQTFAMSFASINGATSAPGIDISAMAQNHAVLQSLPESNRQNYQFIAAAAAAQAAQQKKNFRVSEEGKTGGVDSSSVEEEKKGLSGKVSSAVGQSIAFSRPDLTEVAVSAIPRSTVIDSSTQTLNLVPATSRTARSAISNATSMSTVNASNAQLQAQLQYQQQHMMQLQKQHQQQQQQQQQLAAAAAAGAGRNKSPASSNGSVFGDHVASSSPSVAKFPNTLSGFPQNLVQSSSNSSPAQSTQWKNSARTSTSQGPSSLASSTTSSLKNLPQQQAKVQQTHTQISFGATQKSTAAVQGQQAPSNHQSPSPPMMVGSPTTSSISKGGNGSPRTMTSTSQGNKSAQPSTLSSSQQPKNSASVPSRKSSPVSGRTVPSILGNPHITTTSSTGTKPQQQQPKQNMQQPQLFFSPAYLQQPQAPHSVGGSSSASTTGFYLQRRRPEQSQTSQHSQGPPVTSSTGMLSLCTPTGNSNAKAVVAAAGAAAATGNMKGGSGGSLPSQSILHSAQFTAQSSGNSHQLVPGGFSYVHAVPAGVQVKPAEQKQPAGKKMSSITEDLDLNGNCKFMNGAAIA